MAKKSKEFQKLERKRIKRKGRHSKSPSKSKRLSSKKYNRQGRR